MQHAQRARADATRKLMTLFQLAYAKKVDKSDLPPITLTEVATDTATIMVGDHATKVTFGDEAGFLGSLSKALMLLISGPPVVGAFPASTLTIANAAIILAYERQARDLAGQQPQDTISAASRLKTHVESLYSSLCTEGYCPRIAITKPRLVEGTFEASVRVHTLGAYRRFTFDDAPGFLAQLSETLRTPHFNESQTANIAAANAAVIGTYELYVRGLMYPTPRRSEAKSEPASWSCTLL